VPTERGFGEDQLAIEDDLEAPLRTGDHVDPLDDGRPATEQFVRQTDGTGDIVSGNAELDADEVSRVEHLTSVPHRRRVPA
jgi:hypothetical protein